MKIAVTSRSFSKNKKLCELLSSEYSNVKLNLEGKSLHGDDLVEYLKGADAAIIALEKIDDKILSKLPDLKIISKYGVGLNNLNFEALKNYNVNLGWTAGVNKRSVSELTLTMAIDMLRGINQGNSLVKSGGWKQIIGRQLTGKIYGILGLGNVGQDLVQLLKPFGCKIIANDIKDRSLFANKNDVELVSIDDLLKNSDVLSIHVPLDENTEDFISSNELEKMKKDAVLINTARGGIVNETALKDFLQANSQFIAAFDVLVEEPPLENELIQLENFYITPHIGGSAKESILEMGKSAILGLKENKPAGEYEF